jgi:hypothetical protein
MIEKITYLAKTGTQRLVDNIKSKIIDAKTDMIESVEVISEKISECSDQIDSFEDGLDWKPAVETYADIAITYPEPEDGWTVNVKDTDYTYRYNGEEWIPISANAIPDATISVNGLMTPEKVAKLNALKNYVLPIAGTAELGGVKPDGTTMIVDPETGVVRAVGENNELSKLTNVEIINPINGQSLVYDEIKEKWVNGGSSQVQLDDVTGANVQVVTETQSAILTWTDPNDVEIGGKVLAEWAGTKLVRKIGSAPTDVSDGTLIIDSTVRNQYSSTGYIDSSLQFDTVYYYRFFPYTTTEIYTTGTALSCSLELITVSIPEQTGSLTYDETSQSPIWTSSEGYIASGTQSAIDAGTYYMTATLLPGYIWSDETTEVKQIPWIINKATSNIVATPDSLQLDSTHLSVYTTLSNLLGRTIQSIVVGDDSIVTATYDSVNNIITVDHVNQTNGTTDITVTAMASMNYNASTIVISVTASFISTVLNDNSWEDINKAAINKTASSLWNVGDRKIITLTLGSSTLSYCVYILGFNHNTNYQEDGTIHFQFGFTSLEDGRHIGYASNSSESTTYENATFGIMNVQQDSTSSGTANVRSGFMLSSMSENTLKTFYSYLSNDLKEQIKTAKIQNCFVSRNTDSITFKDLFLPSSKEVFGNNTVAAASYHDKQYDYYKNGNSSIAYYHSSSSKIVNYWLRNVVTGTSSDNRNFSIVTTTGTNSYKNSNYTLSILPVFVIGKQHGNIPSWGDATNEEIVQLLDDHYNGIINLYDYWNIGDERIIHLSSDDETIGEQDVTFVLMNKGGKRLSTSIEGIDGLHNECCFIVGQKNCLKYLKSISDSSTVKTNEGWGVSTLRSWCNDTYRESFPSGLVNIFKLHKNYYNSNGSSVARQGLGSGTISDDYFALPCIREITGGYSVRLTNYNTVYESNLNYRFDYYRYSSSSAKKQGDDGEADIYYATRTFLYNGTASRYCKILNNNNYVALGLTEACGIAPFGVI